MFEQHQVLKRLDDFFYHRDLMGYLLTHFIIFKRDEKRRATHNEVERRRRDKINTWILKLGAIIPEATADMRSGTGGHFEGLSKGGILAKACEYITSLKDTNSR